MAMSRCLVRWRASPPPFAEYYLPDLHPLGDCGRTTEDQFVARMRAGRVYPASVMPWECFGNITDSDLRSIYRYLKTVPPVEVDTGPVYRKIGSFQTP